MLRRTNLFASVKRAIPDTFPVQDLHQHTGADAFNIEAGKPALAIRAGAVCVNLAFVMDASIVTGVTLPEIDKIAEENGYPLKEMAIAEYDELKVNLATIIVLEHYLKEGRRFVGKAADEPLHIVVHTHRASTAIYINHLIARLLQEAIPGRYELVLKETINRAKQAVTEPLLLKIPDLNTEIHFRRGFAEELTDPIYKQTDILFSYSMVGGLSKLLPSSMLIPHTFIPFEEKELKLRVDKTYSVRNHLLEEIDNIVAKPQAHYFELMERSFNTLNRHKPFTARPLTSADFHPVTLLQVYDLFHPTKKEGQPDQMVKVVKEAPVFKM